MLDKDFKEFPHITGELKLQTKGSELINGYNPDLIIANQEGKIKYILESEHKTDRKAFLGDVVKAAHYCEVTQTPAKLIVVMKENEKQTTIEQISNHLKDYFKWLRGLGVSMLKDVLIITDEEYKKSNTEKEIIGSKPFIGRCKSLLHITSDQLREEFLSVIKKEFPSVQFRKQMLKAGYLRVSPYIPNKNKNKRWMQIDSKSDSLSIVMDHSYGDIKKKDVTNLNLKYGLNGANSAIEVRKSNDAVNITIFTSEPYDFSSRDFISFLHKHFRSYERMIGYIQ
ncbi:hypothetical protein GWK91_11015 [Virgibacillus sp. MSP4-1]|uniref:hypothetical protein n=1 Tax=Virgibacillus sp. MSP4-1 TaxID=2700081 RepID=UPI0003A12D54|nr:hypothetical protein [Virgibacillus sp. MSP4-1]QHS23453.1 hypothetical protein GWK91_11015 [Virgibacillus sp. MSP4-1]